MGAISTLLQTWWNQSLSWAQREEGMQPYDAEEEGNPSSLFWRQSPPATGDWDSLAGPRADRLL